MILPHSIPIRVVRNEWEKRREKDEKKKKCEMLIIERNDLYKNDT